MPEARSCVTPIRKFQQAGDFRTRRNTICAAQNQWLSAGSLAGILERLSSSGLSTHDHRVIDSRLAQPPLMQEPFTAAWRLSQYRIGVADSLPSSSGLGQLGHLIANSGNQRKNALLMILFSRIPFDGFAANIAIFDARVTMTDSTVAQINGFWMNSGVT
jgi:hypothetical protein